MHYNPLQKYSHPPLYKNKIKTTDKWHLIYRQLVPVAAYSILNSLGLSVAYDNCPAPPSAVTLCFGEEAGWFVENTLDGASEDLYSRPHYTAD